MRAFKFKAKILRSLVLAKLSAQRKILLRKFGNGIFKILRRGGLCFEISRAVNLGLNLEFRSDRILKFYAVRLGKILRLLINQICKLV